ncbi:hypothetical protein FIBSPDRAFT_765144, partial [Athelia psychrophila]
LDDEGRIAAALVGKPVAEDWPEVVGGLEAAINRLERALSFYAKDEDHRRGVHAAKAFGVSHSGGQKRPSMLRLGSKENERAIDEFRANPYVQRVAGFGSSAFSFFGPKMYERYGDYLSRLCQHDPSLRWNFKNSIFPTTTVNFGPSAVCYDHIDFGNAAAGWCAITAAGNYDPKHGGHLILFDIDKIIEFPPGSTILIPSSVMRHGNTPIREGEMRVSMTQYAAGGIFRWVDNGFVKQDATSEEVKARMAASAPGRFEKLIGLYSTLESLDADRKSVFYPAGAK